MVIQGKIMAASPIQSGISQRGNAWKKCDVIIVAGPEDKEDRFVASVWGDTIDKLSAYPIADHPTWDLELVFSTRRGSSFTSREYQDVTLTNLKPMEPKIF